jgi:hypothetical protein
MNNIKQIREQFDLITEKEEKEDRKLSALVRAGLYDAKKLPALKRALEKSADKITSQEKRMLINLLDSLISQVVSDDQVYRKVRQNVHNVSEAKMDTYSKFDPRYKAGWPTDKEMPSVLILKRKAIRVYPDNQKVALYYSQALDKYVTIPYNDIQFGLNEAKKPEKDEKKKVLRPRIRSKNINMMKKAIDTAHKVNQGAEYQDTSSEIKDSRKKGYSAAVTLGGILHTRSVRKNLQGSKDKVKKTLKTVRTQIKTEKRRKEVSDLTKQKRQTVKAAPTPTPSPAPASVPKTKAKPIVPAVTKSAAATKAAMAKTLKKNPNATFAKRSHQVAANENFQRNLQIIRESRQQVDEVFPLIGAAVATAARVAAPHVIRGAAGLARSGLSALRGAAKSGKKSLLRGMVKARKAARGAAGLAGALSGAGGGGGSDSSSSSSSGGANHKFTAKLKTVEPPNRTNLPSATDKRRQSDSDRANSQLAKSQANESSVLSTIKSIVENNIPEQTIQFNENEITINNTVAKKLLNVYESVNKTNKKKMEQMLNENATSFNKVLTFAVRQ